jgi:hypothetical protein
MSDTTSKIAELNDRLVQFRAYPGSQRHHIGGHIVSFYNV